MSPEQKYKILETLLSHLKEIKNQPLQELAILSAETALGEPLTDLRKKLLNPRPGDTSPSGPPFFSLTEIGEKAGGFSAVTAGRAANNVAAKEGISPQQLRTRSPFTKVYTDQNGRTRFKFSESFAQEVIKELQKNTRSLKKSTPASKYPNYQQDPFSD